MSQTHFVASLENATGPAIAQPPWYLRYNPMWLMVASFAIMLVNLLILTSPPRSQNQEDIKSRLEDPDQGATYLAPLVVWADKAHLEKYSPMCTSTGRCVLTYFSFGAVHGVQLQCTVKGCYPVGGW